METGIKLPPYASVVHKAIKRHAGLSSFDDEPVWDEVAAIVKALRRAGYSVIKE
jgi:hypothetical protein